MKNLALILITVVMTFCLASPAWAQSSITITAVQVEYLFADHITFFANIQPPSMLQDVLVYYLVEGETSAHTAVLTVTEDGSAHARVEIQSSPIRPFARIDFWFHVIPVQGQAVTSSTYSVEYYDNRLAWQTLQKDMIRVYWVSGNDSFGQAVLEKASTALNTFNQLIPLTITEPIDVYIYPSESDMQDALGIPSKSFSGSCPDIGVVVVEIPPDKIQETEMQSQISQELARLLLYTYTGKGYQNLPIWLREGIVSNLELNPNPNYMIALELASKNSTLIPLSSLCDAFPQDAAGAFLAYAESDQVTRYIYNTYGSTGLQALLQAYAGGLDCQLGIERALGLSLEQLDLNWRQAILGEESTSLAFENTLPYLVVLIIILIIPIWTMLGILRIRKKR